MSRRFSDSPVRSWARTTSPWSTRNDSIRCRVSRQAGASQAVTGFARRLENIPTHTGQSWPRPEAKSAQGDVRVAHAGQPVPDLVTGGQLFGVECNIRGRQGVIQMLRPARPENSAGSPGLPEHPGYRPLRQRLAPCREERLQPLDRVELGFLPVAVMIKLGPALEHIEACARICRRALAVFAGEEAAGQRIVGDHPDPLVTA